MTSHNKEMIELSKEQHSQVLSKIDEVATALKAIYIVPFLFLYLFGAGFFFYLDKLPMSVWVGMNVLLLIPLAGVAWKILKQRNGI